MSKISWRTFLFFDFVGSAAYTVAYILIGYFFGKRWKLLEAWLGPTALYLILAGMAAAVLSVMLRHSLSGLWNRLLPKARKGRQ